jgi:hypothetical protein
MGHLLVGNATVPDQLTYYDILGVLPGATTDDVRFSYTAKVALLAPEMISGAPTKVLTAVDRARTVLEEARQTLTDGQARRRYDTEIGILRPGTGLARPYPVPSEGGWAPGWGWQVSYRGSAIAAALAFVADALAPRRRLARRVIVPDARGVFVTPARRLMTLTGLHAELVQLTKNPMPVEGLVVDQDPPPGSTASRSSIVTMRVWHPARRGSQGA